MLLDLRSLLWMNSIISIEKLNSSLRYIFIVRERALYRLGSVAVFRITTFISFILGTDNFRKNFFFL